MDLRGARRRCVDLSCAIEVGTAARVLLQAACLKSRRSLGRTHASTELAVIRAL